MAVVILLLIGVPSLGAAPLSPKIVVVGGTPLDEATCDRLYGWLEQIPKVKLRKSPGFRHLLCGVNADQALGQALTSERDPKTEIKRSYAKVLLASADTERLHHLGALARAVGADVLLVTRSAARVAHIEIFSAARKAVVKTLSVSIDAADDATVQVLSAAVRTTDWGLVVSRPTPWYKKWWVWTIAAGVVGLGLTLLLVNERPEDKMTIRVIKR